MSTPYDQPSSASPSSPPGPGVPLGAFGVVRTGAEHFWYLLQCIYFGAGYLHKVVNKKALSEATALPQR